MKNAKTKEFWVEYMGAEKCSYVLTWKGYKVYSLFYGENIKVGQLYFILEKDGNARLTTQDEVNDIVKYLD